MHGLQHRDTLRPNDYFAMHSSRRHFCTNAAIACFAPTLLRAQTQPLLSGGSGSHTDVAAIDHDRILAAAQTYLAWSPSTITALPCPRNPGSLNDFYSEAGDWWPDPAAPAGPHIRRPNVANPAAFGAHSEALLNFSIQVPALIAAFVLTREVRFASHAADHLRAWFVDPARRMTPALPYAQMVSGTTAPNFEGVIETVHLAEIAQAATFLAHSGVLSETELTAIYAWFAAYLDWLTGARVALLARDQKNHHGSSWLLQVAAFARLAPPSRKGDDHILTGLRHQFKTTTIRAQISADGTFAHELTTPNPYRNSLFNLDMLAGIADLLSTRFESMWEYELQDGPGMRTAIAHHFPFIVNRRAWPYRADATHFTDLPVRQPSLLLAGRAYSRPDYVDLWKTLNPDPTDPVIQRCFPIRQPLLWVRRAPAL